MNDNINPQHYKTTNGFECIDAIEAIIPQSSATGLQLFLWANAFKYIWRLFQKGSAIENARKAIWYLERLIKDLEKQSTTPS